MSILERNRLLRATAIVRDYKLMYDRYYPDTFVEFCEDYHKVEKEIIDKARYLIIFN